MRIVQSIAALVVLAAAAVVGSARPDPREARPPAGFDPPEVVLDGSAVDRRLFPAFADVDRDGVADLLVGIPNRLLIYRARGTAARPAYAKPAWLDEALESARIPDG